MVWKLLLLCLISGHPWSSVYMSVFIADVRQSPCYFPEKTSEYVLALSRLCVYIGLVTMV